MIGRASIPGRALPIGSVMTLPGTGSEMNSAFVISRESTREKISYGSYVVYPKFSILDPEVTYSLPRDQTANGIVDTFVHVVEQYVTYPVYAPLQDRQAEALLATIIEEGPKALTDPTNYNIRAVLMWCATQAVNGLISRGVPQDWATHNIGHEITALYGLDHARTLAIVLPGLWQNQIAHKSAKLAQYGRRVWGLRGDDDAVAKEAIAKTEAFFESLGVPTRFSSYGINGYEVAERICFRFAERGRKALGENQSVGIEQIRAILSTRA
jgi:NADP-dependent alcohol dehydrogenase